jgi:hypothetical protein
MGFQRGPERGGGAPFDWSGVELSEILAPALPAPFGKGFSFQKLRSRFLFM